MAGKVFADVVSQILLEEDLNCDRFPATEGEHNCRNEPNQRKWQATAPLGVSSVRISHHVVLRTEDISDPKALNLVVVENVRSCARRRVTPLLLATCEFGGKSSKKLWDSRIRVEDGNDT